jgi:hypothetical protein
MLTSDLLGLLSALLLAVPAGRDQINRFQEARQRRQAAKKETPFWPLRGDLADVWRARREGFNGWDSALTAAGAALLVATFALKMGGA